MARRRPQTALTVANLDDANKALGELAALDLEASAIKSVLNEKVDAAMARGEQVSIQGFGTFQPVKKAARIGRNPRTGENVEIPAKVSVKFKPGKELLARVNLGAGK